MPISHIWIPKSLQKALSNSRPQNSRYITEHVYINLRLSKKLNTFVQPYLSRVTKLTVYGVLGCQEKTGDLHVQYL